MANLDWLVVRDLYEIESATFWKNSPEIETGEIVPEECRTEVFLLPAASHVEKEGTFTQTQRMVQWREKALEPVGDCRSELWFFYLGRMVKERLAGSTDPKDRPVLDLAWDYPVEASSTTRAPRPCSGRSTGTRSTRAAAVDVLRAEGDGSTVGGCWIYTGVFADGVNQAARRKPGGEQSGWPPSGAGCGR